jgi:hypothetical protein
MLYSAAMDEVIERLNNATSLAQETGAFLVHRLKIYAIFGGVLLAYWFVVLVVYALIYSLVGSLALLFLLVGIAGNWVVAHAAKSWLLYTVQAGHIAVLTQVASGALPAGVTQTQFAAEQVKARFPDAALLANAERIAHRTIKKYNRTLEDMASWVPIPGMHLFVPAVNFVAQRAAGMLSAVVLASVFQRKDQQMWPALKDGVVLYAQGFKPVIKLATGLVIFDFLCSGVLVFMLLVVLGMPTAMIFRHWASIRPLAVVVPFIITYLVRQVVMEPLALTALVVDYLRILKNSTPDPAIEEKLSAIPEFQELVAKAGGDGEAPPPEDAAPPPPPKAAAGAARPRPGLKRK